MSEAASATDMSDAATPAAPAAPAASSSSASTAAAAPAAPRVLPHPPEYYSVPSTSSNALLPRYTAAELAAIAALPEESSGYVPIVKHHLITPFNLAKDKAKLPLSVPAPGLGLPSPEPEPAAADAPATKKARTESGSAATSTGQAHDPNAPPSSSCPIHEHGSRGDEFDAEEAAGAKDHLRTSDQADREAAAARAASASSSSAVAAAPTDAASSAPSADAAAEARDKRKRGRGQNKNADREFFNVKATQESRMCKSIAQGKPCQWGDKCRWSHDVEAHKRTMEAQSYPGACPVWARFGVCAAGLSCKWSSGHGPEHTPATPAVLQKELNALPRDLGQDLKSCSLEGPKYEKIFPRSAALTKRYEVWRRKAESIRNKRQAEKEAQQRIQNAEAKAAALAAKTKPATTPAADAAATSTATTPAATAPTPAADAAVPMSDAPAVAISSSSASASPTAAASTASSSTAVTSISASFLPPSFVAHDLETELAIDALKASYTPSVPRSVDPFQIVSEEYADWSSGCILIDLERKPLDFKGKLVLAPLTTVGNLPFRRVCLGFGAGVTIGEMAMSNSLGKGAANEWALLRRHESEKFFGAQIAASHPDQVSRACELIAKTCTVDFVDLNIGCPIDGVTDKGMGSAMMQRRRMKNVEPIIRTMRTILDCPATIKMRMGWSGQELTAMELLPIVHRSGLAAVTIHGRTRQQRYTKSADWQFIQQAATFAKQKLHGLPVIANGDVYTFEDYEDIVGNSDVTTTMIARGALVKPWIFTEIAERRHWDISASERLDMLRSFVQFGHEHFGTDTKGVEATRRYLLEWLSFLHRYVPVGLLERPRVSIQQKNPPFYARNDLEQLLGSSDAKSWIRISEMLIGPVPDGFKFTPKHKSATQSEESG